LIRRPTRTFQAKPENDDEEDAVIPGTWKARTAPKKKRKQKDTELDMTEDGEPSIPNHEKLGDRKVREQFIREFMNFFYRKEENSVGRDLLPNNDPIEKVSCEKKVIPWSAVTANVDAYLDVQEYMPGDVSFKEPSKLTVDETKKITDYWRQRQDDGEEVIFQFRAFLSKDKIILPSVVRKPVDRAAQPVPKEKAGKGKPRGKAVNRGQLVQSPLESDTDGDSLERSQQSMHNDLENEGCAQPGTVDESDAEGDGPVTATGSSGPTGRGAKASAVLGSNNKSAGISAPEEENEPLPRPKPGPARGKKAPAASERETRSLKRSRTNLSDQGAGTAGRPNKKSKRNDSGNSGAHTMQMR
jgi:hypothetical protein